MDGIAHPGAVNPRAAFVNHRGAAVRGLRTHARQCGLALLDTKDDGHRNGLRGHAPGFQQAVDGVSILDEDGMNARRGPRQSAAGGCRPPR